MKTRMKKIIISAVAAVMAITMSFTALALPSPTVSGYVKGIKSAIDADGKSVQIIIQTIAEADLTSAEIDALAAIRKEETIKSIMGSAWIDGMQLADLRKIIIVGDVSLVKFPITVTFDVPGIKASSKVAILFFDTNSGTWKMLKCKAGDGTIEAIFDSVFTSGLLAFIVDLDTANNLSGITTNNGSTNGSTGTTTIVSPKTGESNLPIYAGLAAVVLIGGAALVIYKKGKHAA